MWTRRTPAVRCARRDVSVIVGQSIRPAGECVDRAREDQDPPPGHRPAATSIGRMLPGPTATVEGPAVAKADAPANGDRRAGHLLRARAQRGRQPALRGRGTPTGRGHPGRSAPQHTDRGGARQARIVGHRRQHIGMADSIPISWAHDQQRLAQTSSSSRGRSHRPTPRCATASTTPWYVTIRSGQPYHCAMNPKPSCGPSPRPPPWPGGRWRWTAPADAGNGRTPPNQSPPRTGVPSARSRSARVPYCRMWMLGGC
jgi:hypothetical protein